MTFEVAKTFERNGVRYRPGGPLPSDLDKQTLDHYKRHGMVRPASRAPAEKKPASQRTPARTPQRNKATVPGPTQTTAAATPVATGAPLGPADSTALPGPDASTSTAPAASALADAPGATGGQSDPQSAADTASADQLAGSETNPS